MAYPKYPDYGEVTSGNGDEITHSPNKTTPSLLASERGTQNTRRIETDSNRNVYVRVAADDTAPPSSVTALVVGSITTVPAASQQTVASYTAGSATKVTRISCSGTIYAKFQIYKNLSLIETVRSGPDRSISLEFSSPLSLSASDIIDVKVTHFFTGHTEDFDATVYGG